MKRVDRARLIRDDLLARQSGWERTCLGSKNVASLEWQGLNVVLSSQIRSDADPDVRTHWLYNRHIHNSPRDDPYTLDVWIDGLRVLSITWNDRDDLTLLSMVRGLWECECFNLPLPNGTSFPTMH